MSPETLATQPIKVRFGSRYAKLRVVVNAPRPRYHPITGAFLESDVGKTAEFKDYVYETSDPEEIEALRKMTLHGSTEVVELTDADRGFGQTTGVEITSSLSSGKGSVKPEGRYPCSDCGKAFRNPQALLFHKKVHEPKGPPAVAEGASSPGPAPE